MYVLSLASSSSSRFLSLSRFHFSKSALSLAATNANSLPSLLCLPTSTAATSSSGGVITREYWSTKRA